MAMLDRSNCMALLNLSPDQVTTRPSGYPLRSRNMVLYLTTREEPGYPVRLTIGVCDVYCAYHKRHHL